MSSVGYAKAESVRIMETEYTTGGRMGAENFKNITPGLKEIGESKLTYANKTDLNLKNIIRETSNSGPSSSTKSITYDLIKPYGQSNEVTAEYYSNKSRDYGQGATFLENAIKVIRAALKK